MADTLSNIQSDARFWANDRNLTIVSGTGLRIFNAVYQGMFSEDFRIAGIQIGRRWPENTAEDTSLTMIVGQEQYTWPVSPVFKPGFFLEGLDASSNNEPYVIESAISSEQWSFFDDSNNATPLIYRLIDVSGVVKLAIRPTPDSADPIRITGMKEITELTDGTKSTVFLNNNSDKALAKFIAAEYKAKRGDPERALQLIAEGRAFLPLYDYAPRFKPVGHIRPWGV